MYKNINKGKQVKHSNVEIQSNYCQMFAIKPASKGAYM